MITELVFYVFSAMLLTSGLMVITSLNPVRGVLFLICAFIASSVLWILLAAEFLALILVLVYVGAVMTLFLFVVMMLDIDLIPRHEGFVRYLAIGILVALLLVVLMIWAISPEHFGWLHSDHLLLDSRMQVNNVTSIGMVLYTQYQLPFELAGVLLLVAMISAISLAFRGRRTGSKSQRIAEQVAVDAKQRVRLVKMPSEPKYPPSAEGDK